VKTKSTLGRRMCAQLCLVFSTFLISIAPAYANGPSPNAGVAAFETAFLKNMVGHHQMAVDMGNLCLQKAVHQELRSMCSTIVTAQRKEIGEMRAWLASWYGIHNYHPAMSEEDMKQMRHLSMLNNSDFEIEFMKHMMMHHKMAVTRSGQCMQWGYHGKLIGTCQNIVLSQTEEVRKMEDWLRLWYGIYVGRFSKN
jgi:uncharacterized protein (DUF305 family)